jgi:hypothetical protein
MAGKPETSGLVGKPDARDPVGPGAARMLYNLADALHPELLRDLVPEAARTLRHRGPGGTRRMHCWLALLEWEPLLVRPRRRFWRLPREERRAACERFRGSRFAWRRRAWAELSAWVEDALAAAPGGESKI